MTEVWIVWQVTTQDGSWLMAQESVSSVHASEAGAQARLAHAAKCATDMYGPPETQNDAQAWRCRDEWIAFHLTYMEVLP